MPLFRVHTTIHTRGTTWPAVSQPMTQAELASWFKILPQRPITKIETIECCPTCNKPLEG